ncbi:MAG TPA: response regulator [Opitutaceae bacterium]|nr:response regulator [Opitutaceae bacterium]
MNDERKADVLLVDDEEQIRRLLRCTLEDDGYSVREAATGRIALGEIALQEPGFMILDLGLPDTSGIEVLRTMRLHCSAPVLVLTVLGHEKNKIAALDAGADDYLVKPFRSGELLARVRALLRRVQAPLTVGSQFVFGRIQVDLVRSRVLCDGRLVKLTNLEYKLLRLLVINHDKVLTHRYILNELWGPQATEYTHYLRAYILRLRKKLDDAVDSTGHFQTESGVGYRFVSKPELGESVL